MLIRLVIFVTAALAIYGCIGGGGPSPYTGTGAVCDVRGLSSQVTKLQDQSESTRLALAAGLPKGGGAAGFEDQQANVLREYEVLKKRLNRFDAEIDAQHQNVVRSCNNYTRCMEYNRYNEGKCRSGLARWDEAEDEFTGLARELREIDAEVAKFRIIARNCCKGGPVVHYPTVNRYECDCSESVGGVFANCCDYDSDSVYDKKRRY